MEIINCAVPGHSPGQRWCHFTQVGWPMKPDLVIYESTAADVGWDERRLRYLLARGMAWDSPIYHARAGTKPVSSGWAVPTITSALTAPPLGNPGGRLPDDGRRVPRAGRADHSGLLFPGLAGRVTRPIGERSLKQRAAAGFLPDRGRDRRL